MDYLLRMRTVSGGMWVLIREDRVRSRLPGRVLPLVSGDVALQSQGAQVSLEPGQHLAGLVPQ